MGLDIIPASRSEAKQAGEKFYFTGKACSRGGLSKRLTVSGMCLCDLCHKARLEIKSKSYRRTKDTTVKDYLERNKKRLAEEAKEYREANKERISAYLRDYYLKNPNKFKKHRRLRKIAEKTRIPSWFCEFDDFVIQQAHLLASERKEETGINWHVDHMIPLRAKKVCGLHCAENIQVIPGEMNLSKLNKMQLTERLEWLK